MENGLYKVQFQTPQAIGFGVVTLRDGVIQGGDSMMYYVGTYRQNGGNVEASVRTEAHSQIPGMASVLGTTRADLSLSGTTNPEGATLTGSAPQAPGVNFQAHLFRLPAGR